MPGASLQHATFGDNLRLAISADRNSPADIGNLRMKKSIRLGLAAAAINYRLVPGATVEDEAADVAASLKYLIDHAAALGIDPSRIVLMGHSAGAHLVALVGTDERYLKAADLSFASISGVIPVDGAAYDVPRQIAEGGDRKSVV